MCEGSSKGARLLVAVLEQVAAQQVADDAVERLHPDELRLVEADGELAEQHGHACARERRRGAVRGVPCEGRRACHVPEGRGAGLCGAGRPRAQAVCGGGYS